ncbi:MAG: Sec-independent protein translocase subunit TatA/TatB [Candidatus Hodarchaeales archaeon]|jgi:sec-independent protein translocase protein TatA
MVGIGPMEIAFVIGIAVLLLGPDKIPSLGRSIGNAMKEYQDALKGVKSAAESPKQVGNQFINALSKEPSEDEKLIESAKQLGIQTDGKTIEQISKEILEEF